MDAYTSRLYGFVVRRFNLICAALIVLIVAVAVWFGFRKHGFYIDEYYTYTLSNGTQLGIDIIPGEWNDTSRFMGQLVSEGEENFRFDKMYDVVASDVHPLLYYILVHFVSSVFSGAFSKWIGLSINIALLIPTLILVKKITWILTDEDRILTLISVLMFGLSPVTISMVMLIRMYLLLTMWTLLYAYLHLKDLDRDELSAGRFLIPVFLCGFFGFLTQYFFVVVMFFITFVYAFYLMVFCHRIKDSVIYGITALASLICTYFVWPISYFHIFRGYRGKGAMSQMKDISAIGSRMRTTLGYLDRMVFAGTIPLFLLMLIGGVILILRRCMQIRKKERGSVMSTLSVPTKGFVMLLISSVLIYLVLSQIGLNDGITSVRQYYSAYSLFLVLLPVGMYRLIRGLEKKPSRIPAIMTVSAVALVLILSYARKNVLYLYEDEINVLNYAKEHPDSKVVMFQGDDGMYDSRIQDLILYPKVFFASTNDPDTAKDSIIATSDSLLVYMDKRSDNTDECFDVIYGQNGSIKQADHLWDTDFFSVYHMY